MSRIYLICAAESEAETYRIAQGHFDTGLTKRGLRQAEALEKRFADVPVDMVYSSDLYRAYTTANAISKAKGLTIFRRKDLREIFLGVWEGKPWGNIAYDKRREVERFRSAPGSWNIGGAETPVEAAERLLSALREIAVQADGQTVVVVSHSVVIQLALGVLRDIPLSEIRPLPPEQYTAVSVLSMEGGELCLLSEQNTEHLSSPEYLAQERPRREFGFDTDLYIQQMHWVEYSSIMAQAVEYVREESGEDRPFDSNRLIGDAAMFPATIAYAEYEPAGFLQVGLDPSWITLICTHPGCRGAGLGTQLVGQAVLSAREKGLDELQSRKIIDCWDNA